MNTVKFEHKRKPLMVAHRGLSGIETEFEIKTVEDFIKAIKSGDAKIIKEQV